MMLCTLDQKAEEDLDFLKPACGHSNIPQNVSNYISNHSVTSQAPSRTTAKTSNPTLLTCGMHKTYQVSLRALAM